MQITVLAENTSIHPACIPSHGLSLWIETARHRLLMDAGPDDVFLSNAHAQNVDLSQADMLVLSHGHYDHSGGILPFAARYPHVPVMMRTTALLPYYSGSLADGTLHCIGVDPAIASLPQLRLLNDDAILDEDLRLFGGVTGRKCWPESNRRLSKKQGDAYVQDDFRHEQYLVVTENKRSLLLSGCAHNGILNILDRYHELYGSAPDIVISGFHMKKSSPYTTEEEQTIRATAHELLKWPCLFYTCHCTGLPAFQMMKEIMGDQLQYAACGQKIRL